jgi:transcription initiation factor TFIIA large subunit
MSNKIVPTIYRTVIDEVINAIKPEFDEYGVPEDVLADLLSKWESKVIASHVAEFDAQAQPPPSTQPAQQPQQPPPQAHPYPTQPVMQMAPQLPHAYPTPHNPYSGVKVEPIDTRYILSASPGQQYTLPPLTTALNGGRHLPMPAPGMAYPGVPAARYAPPAPASSQPPPRIPQVDGPSSYGSDDDDEDSAPSGSQGQYAPRSNHPSLPQPVKASEKAVDEEAINSDLDDSDTGDEADDDEGNVGETDIVFCTYDKVARVKNKWKCVLKDGMVHVNGKDYLFAKCTGEFEW